MQHAIPNLSRDGGVFQLIHKVYHLKSNPTTRYKNETRSRSTPVAQTSPSLVTLDSRSPLLLGHCSRQLRKSCADATSFIHEQNACSFELPNNTKIHQLVANFRYSGTADACLQESSDHLEYLL
jgi:hypothetical protein